LAKLKNSLKVTGNFRGFVLPVYGDFIFIGDVFEFDIKELKKMVKITELFRRFSA
jgi:hypothetical protein